MRIAIIGAGAAGLTSAFLLDGQHEVTLFEREPRCGGHARTIEVERDGLRTTVETGFEFFHRKLWPTFCRLLDRLGVTLRPYAGRVTVFRTDRDQTTVVPPWGLDGKLRLADLGPSKAFQLAQFGAALASIAPAMRARDTTLTVRAALERAPITRAFRDDFFFPHLLAGWCLEPGELLELAAYDVFRYAYMSLSLRGSIAFLEVEGGMRAYVDALLQRIPNVTVRPGCAVAGITRDGARLLVHDAAGRTQDFDQVLLATNARQAAALLAGLRGAEQVRRLLASIDYFKTAIAVHGDRRLMPARERDWSVVNVRYDGVHAQSTIWKRGRGDVFRSWVTFDARMPASLDHLVEFEHARVTPRYFATQRALGARQGQDGLWLAGMHMHDIDSHESAVLSAVQVVERIAPSAPRLAGLRHG